MKRVWQNALRFRADYWFVACCVLLLISNLVGFSKAVMAMGFYVTAITTTFFAMLKIITGCPESALIQEQRYYGRCQTLLLFFGALLISSLISKL
jgi:hypothetical protein